MAPKKVPKKGKRIIEEDVENANARKRLPRSAKDQSVAKALQTRDTNIRQENNGEQKPTVSKMKKKTLKKDLKKKQSASRSATLTSSASETSESKLQPKSKPTSGPAESPDSEEQSVDGSFQYTKGKKRLSKRRQQELQEEENEETISAMLTYYDLLENETLSFA